MAARSECELQQLKVLGEVFPQGLHCRFLVRPQREESIPPRIAVEAAKQLGLRSGEKAPRDGEGIRHVAHLLDIDADRASAPGCEQAAVSAMRDVEMERGMRRAGPDQRLAVTADGEPDLGGGLAEIHAE